MLFVVDGDLTQAELTALRALAAVGRPLLLVLNKTDRYSEAERTQLRDALREQARSGN